MNSISAKSVGQKTITHAVPVRECGLYCPSEGRVVSQGVFESISPEIRRLVVRAVLRAKSFLFQTAHSNWIIKPGG